MSEEGDGAHLLCGEEWLVSTDCSGNGDESSDVVNAVATCQQWDHTSRVLDDPGVVNQPTEVRGRHGDGPGWRDEVRRCG